ncbi:DUF1192 domain-containing protein [Dongia mobilis]|jgi:uncharacterized small protein (DUF1192 family)|uniref:DUF1192 domain-containing protein n=1 Tax=Dongia sp. TaxID=1977262 RepID=UPI0026E997F4
MDTDDLDPKTKRPKLRNLDPMGVEELQAYIAELKEEIARVEADIAKKKQHLSAAASLFKS